MKTATILLSMLFLMASCSNNTNGAVTIVPTMPTRTRTQKPLETPKIADTIHPTQENRATQIERSRLTKTAQANLTVTSIALTPTYAKVTFVPSPTNTPTPTFALSPSPTFAVASIVTRTPSPSAQCPPANPNLTADLNTLFDASKGGTDDEALLAFLNSGGTPQSVVATFAGETAWFTSDFAIQEDITGDNVPEFILADLWSARVFGCKNGEYEILLTYTEDPAALRYIKISVPRDMNRNGVPELLTNAQWGHMNVEHYITIFEWNGEQFDSIIQGDSYAEGRYFPYAVMSGVTQVDISDIDGNGTLELVLSGSPPSEGTTSYEFGIPWRNETHIYMWNGSVFSLSKILFSPPEYRFQAVQDGDRAFLSGDYEQARKFYQQVISDQSLDWWSRERWAYEIQNLVAQPDDPPIPTPIPDSTEYPNLAAYAHFRMLLLYLIQGDANGVEQEFTIIKENFTSEQPGYAYVELAAILLSEYQKSENIGDACQEVVEYAKLHPVETLSYLGNGEYARTDFGAQSLEYTPNSICPFR